MTENITEFAGRLVNASSFNLENVTETVTDERRKVSTAKTDTVGNAFEQKNTSKVYCLSLNAFGTIMKAIAEL